MKRWSGTNQLRKYLNNDVTFKYVHEEYISD